MTAPVSSHSLPYRTRTILLGSLALLACEPSEPAPGRLQGDPAAIGSDAAATSAEPLSGASVEPGTGPAGPGSQVPHLSPAAGGALMSWLEPVEVADETTSGESRRRRPSRWALRFSRWSADGGWGPASTVTEGEDFFVNWADYPSVTEVDGTLVAHWLQRGSQGGYDYGVRLVTSEDDGTTWSEAWKPHTDDTPTEHGFVSTFPHPEGGFALVWLDGRAYAEEAPGGATQEMALRARAVLPGGTPGPEVTVDGRTCDCCPTDAAVTDEGPVVVYRDRSADEIRDIALSRYAGGAWSPPSLVHSDGWRIEACPVNGPAVAASGSDLAVAWFTAANDDPRVLVAFSSDAGDTFTQPVRVDGGNPVGRTDVALLDDGSALVSWIEATEGTAADLRIRTVRHDGTLGGPKSVGPATTSRASGFPQMIVVDRDLLFAWTDATDDPTTVRVVRAPLPGGRS